MKYSRRLIENAIRHWQRVLNETNIATLMNRLEEAFGRRNVYTSDKNVKINQENVTTLYNILNDVCFDNKLKIPEFEYSSNPTDQAGKPLPPNAQGGYIISLDRSYDNSVHIGGRAKIVFRKFNSRPHLLFFASVLCHEMIHQHNMEHGPELGYLTWCLNTNQQPNMHPEFFTRMMDRLIKEQRLGMSVTLKYDIESYTKELVMYARIGDDKYREADARKVPYNILIDDTADNINMNKDHDNTGDDTAVFNEAEAATFAKELTTDMIDSDIKKNGYDSFFSKNNAGDYSVCLI